MALNLCIDWGNSLVKAALFENGKIAEQFSYSPSDATAAITELVDDRQPSYAIISSVSKQSADVEEALTARVSRFLKLTDTTPLPIINAYSAGSLGTDRLAVAVAAHVLYPGKNNLVVCLGTCVTYNFVQSNRTFRGGAISPGLQMRLRAMHEFTDQLPKVPLDGETLLLGYDTETCMRSGAVFGIMSEVDGMVNEFSAQYPDFNAVLTGGDLRYFEGKLKSKIFADPDFVLKGLNIILKHNVPQAS